MEDALGRAHGQHEVGLDERGVHAERDVPVRSELDEVVGLDVVHLDAPAKAAGEVEREERLELAAERTTRQPCGDEDGLIACRDADRLELRDRGGDRLLARVEGGAGDGEGRRLDDDGGVASLRHGVRERRPGEREAERVTDGGAHVAEGLAGRRRPEDRRVVRCVREHDARAREQRHPHGIARYSRRCVARQPRRGQKREARRFTLRQSAVTERNPCSCAQREDVRGEREADAGAADGGIGGRLREVDVRLRHAEVAGRTAVEEQLADDLAVALGDERPERVGGVEGVLRPLGLERLEGIHVLAGEARRPHLVDPQLAVEAREVGEVVLRPGPDRHARVHRRHGLRLAHGVGELEAEADPEPGVDECGVERGGDDGEPAVPLLVPALGRGGEQVASELGLDRRVAGEAAEDPAAAAVVVRGGRAEEVADEPTVAERGDAARVLARELLRHLRAVVHLARQQRLDVAVSRVHVRQQAGRAVEVVLRERDELEGHRRRTIPSAL